MKSNAFHWSCENVHLSSLLLASFEESASVLNKVKISKASPTLSSKDSLSKLLVILWREIWEMGLFGDLSNFLAKVVNTYSNLSFMRPKSSEEDILLIISMSVSPSSKESSNVASLDLTWSIYSCPSSISSKPICLKSIGSENPTIKSLDESIILDMISAF